MGKCVKTNQEALINLAQNKKIGVRYFRLTLMSSVVRRKHQCPLKYSNGSLTRIIRISQSEKICSIEIG